MGRQTTGMYELALLNLGLLITVNYMTRCI